MLTLRSMLLVPILAGLACSSSHEFAQDPPSLPHLETAEPSGGSSPAPKGLRGVDTASLSGREKQAWWRLVAQLYSPCPDQAVSLVQCVDEARACNACTPMAQFLADRIHKGQTSVDAEAAAALRFGPDVKTIDLVGSPSRGPATAPLTIVVWLDFQCPACRHTEPVIEEFRQKHANDVRLVHKIYVLPKHATFGGPAAKAAIAAHRQGKFWEMEHVLFDNQKEIEEGTVTVEQCVKKVGLDMKRYAVDVDSKETTEYLEHDMKQADEAGLRATPLVFLNGRHFDQDYFRFDELEEWLKLELALQKK